MYRSRLLCTMDVLYLRLNMLDMIIQLLADIVRPKRNYEIFACVLILSTRCQSFSLPLRSIKQRGLHVCRVSRLGT